MPKHRVIIIPGLGDNVRYTAFLTRHWQKYGLDVIVHPIVWDDSASFRGKLDVLLALIDDFAATRDKISLVGISAGNSAALNAFYERKDKIHRVIGITGRNRIGKRTGWRSFEGNTRNSKPFAESVKLMDSRLATLTSEDKKKITIVTPKFGDQYVKSCDVEIAGAGNIQIFSMGHIVSITLALTLFSNKLIKFLLGDD